MFLQTFLDYGNIRGCAIYKILPFRHSSEYPTVIIISFFQAQPNFNCQLVSPSDYFNRASVSKFHQSASPSIVSLSPAHPKRKKTNQKKTNPTSSSNRQNKSMAFTLFSIQYRLKSTLNSHLRTVFIMKHKLL